MIINNVDYRVGKLSAIEQFHIARRLATVFGSAVGKDENKRLAAIVESIGKLPDCEAEYVLFGLLKAVSRDLGKGIGYAPLVNNGLLMYEDIDMVSMLKLAGAVLKENMAGFMKSIPSNLVEQTQEAKTP